jgi:hypothetical protein
MKVPEGSSEMFDQEMGEVFDLRDNEDLVRNGEEALKIRRRSEDEFCDREGGTVRVGGGLEDLLA